MESWILYMGTANLVLFLIFLTIFFPRDKKNYMEGFFNLRLHLIILILVVLFHLFEVNFIDRFTTNLIGKDFAPVFYSYEKGFFEYLSQNTSNLISIVSVFFYMILYPFTLWFSPLLFLIGNEEKAMRSLSYGLVIIYLCALPFYLFLPVTNVYTYLGIDFHLGKVIPGIEKFFYAVTTKNNCFPSLHVAMALLLVKSSSFMRDRRYFYITLISALGVIFSVLYLSIHWITDVIGGISIFLIACGVVNYENSIEKEVLRKITPSFAERRKLNRIVLELLDKIEKEIKKENIKAVPKLVGSVAKDTYLRDSVDIDIFLLFPPNTPRKEMERKGLLIGRKILEKHEERYAEHPYIRGKYKGYDVEIVPCYRVKKASEKISAVDRTPFHTDFIRENLPFRKRKDVRLLKRFLKGIGCYGAEAEVEGFSGYLCELLILKYGSFENVLRNAKDWKKGEIIKLKEVPSPAFNDPLVFIDPVDPNRNVASAVSEEKLEIFKRACKEYLEKPSERFFFPQTIKPLPDEEIKKHLDGFIGVEIEKPDIIPDNLYPQAKKTLRRIVKSCEENDFEIEDGRFVVTEDKIYILLKPKEIELPETYIHRGPPEKEKRHVEAFLEKWRNSKEVVKGPYLKDGRWYVEVKRKYNRLDDFLAENLRKLSLGKDIEEVVKDGKFSILTSKDLLRDDLKLFWTEYIENKMPWER